MMNIYMEFNNTYFDHQTRRICTQIALMYERSYAIPYFETIKTITHIDTISHSYANTYSNNYGYI